MAGPKLDQMELRPSMAAETSDSDIVPFFPAPVCGLGSGRGLHNRLRSQTLALDNRSITRIRAPSAYVRAKLRLIKLRAGHGRPPASTCHELPRGTPNSPRVLEALLIPRSYDV